MSSSSPAPFSPAEEAPARANVHAIARTITPDRPPPTIAFTKAPIDARFHYASDTLWLHQDLVPVAAQGTDNPILRALVAHELGHRTDGRPGISRLPLPTLLAVTAVMLLTCAAFLVEYVGVGVGAGAVGAAALFALAVRARWDAEYRCDDFAADRTDSSSVIAMLDALAAAARDRPFRGGPRRWAAVLFGWVTHPPSRRRAQRQRARAAAVDR